VCRTAGGKTASPVAIDPAIDPAPLTPPRDPDLEHAAEDLWVFGTQERPGLVLGLDHGGACNGIAFRVAAKARPKTIAYLRRREQVTAVYRETVRRISLKGEPTRMVAALCYVVDRGHVQYAGRLPLDEQLHHIRQGHGQSGANRDYVIATVAAMEALGVRESELHLLAARLKGAHEGERA